MAPAGGSGGLKGIYRQRKKASRGGGVAKPSSAAPSKRSKAKPKPHQQQQSTQLGPAEAEEEELRRFDMDMAYGPCVGFTRLRRWDRAAAMGLRPPPRLRDILLRRCSPAADAADNSSLTKSRSPPPSSMQLRYCIWEGKI